MISLYLKSVWLSYTTNTIEERRERNTIILIEYGCRNIERDTNFKFFFYIFFTFFKNTSHKHKTQQKLKRYARAY